MKFPLGRIVATPGAIEVLDSAKHDASTLLDRHVNGDWVNISAADARENEFSLKNDLRLLSAYDLGSNTRIWIITEADRSLTTLLLPEEY